MLARFGFFGFDRIGFISGDDFAVQRDFNAFDVLVGQNLDFNLGIFAQCLGEEIIGQEEQRNGDRRAQRGGASGAAAVRGLDHEREVVARAVRGHIGMQSDDILRAEEIHQVLINAAQLLQPGRKIEAGVGLGRD